MNRQPRISKCWSEIRIFWSVPRFSNFGPSPVRDFQNWVRDHKLGTELIREFKNDVGPGIVRDSDFLVRSKIFKSSWNLVRSRMFGIRLVRVRSGRKILNFCSIW